MSLRPEGDTRLLNIESSSSIADPEERLKSVMLGAK
jgi:hypothetical protein